MKDGIYFSPKFGRLVEHRGQSTKYYWSPQQLDYLRRHYPNTANEELAGCLGVCVRTMMRKAREIGLSKDPAYIRRIGEAGRNIARAVNKRNGNPGQFRKGEHRSPGTEFKPGQKHKEATKAKIAEALRRWHRANPGMARVNALKAWNTKHLNS